MLSFPGEVHCNILFFFLKSSNECCFSNYCIKVGCVGLRLCMLGSSTFPCGGGVVTGEKLILKVSSNNLILFVQVFRIVGLHILAALNTS